MPKQFFLVLGAAALLLSGCQDATPPAEPEAPAPTPDVAPPRELPTVSAEDNDALEAHVGSDVAVEGTVVRIGATQAGDITFLNFTRQRGGFTAVIRRASYENFPDGFGAYDGRGLRVTGVLEKFRGETPQIEVTDPEQLQIIAR